MPAKQNFMIFKEMLFSFKNVKRQIITDSKKDIKTDIKTDVKQILK